MAFLRKNESTLLPTINISKPELAYLADCSSDGRLVFCASLESRRVLISCIFIIIPSDYRQRHI